MHLELRGVEPGLAMLQRQWRMGSCCPCSNLNVSNELSLLALGEAHGFLLLILRQGLQIIRRDGQVWRCNSLCCWSWRVCGRLYLLLFLSGVQCSKRNNRNENEAACDHLAIVSDGNRMTDCGCLWPNRPFLVFRVQKVRDAREGRACCSHRRRSVWGADVGYFLGEMRL